MKREAEDKKERWTLFSIFCFLRFIYIIRCTIIEVEWGIVRVENTIVFSSTKKAGLIPSNDISLQISLTTLLHIGNGRSL
jgi:hypothetical protein